MKFETEAHPSIICGRCRVPMEATQRSFTYLGIRLTANVPSCPKCGQVYIPPDIAEGKMAEMEMMTEEK